MKLYAIKDTIVGKFMNPFLMNNDEEAKRAFKIAINSGEKTTIVIHYKDMSLFALGEYSPETGEIKSDVYHIANGQDVKETYDFSKNYPNISNEEEEE